MCVCVFFFLSAFARCDSSLKAREGSTHIWSIYHQYFCSWTSATVLIGMDKCALFCISIALLFSLLICSLARPLSFSLPNWKAWNFFFASFTLRKQNEAPSLIANWWSTSHWNHCHWTIPINHINRLWLLLCTYQQLFIWCYQYVNWIFGRPSKFKPFFCRSLSMCGFQNKGIKIVSLTVRWHSIYLVDVEFDKRRLTPQLTAPKSTALFIIDSTKKHHRRIGARD